MNRSWFALCFVALALPVAWPTGAEAAAPTDMSAAGAFPPAAAPPTPAATDASATEPGAAPAAPAAVAGAGSAGEPVAPVAPVIGEPPTPPTDSFAATAGVPMMDEAEQEVSAARYGLGVRARWVSVPSWLLGLFLDKSVPLSSYTIGAEVFRRSGNFDLVLGVAWQAMSPGDGNWLGKSSPPNAETNYVQFRGLGAVSVDAAFILRTNFNDFVSVHYGGGVGIGITTGRMLRTLDDSPGCATNPGNPSLCFPVIPGCTSGPCSESALQASQGSGAAPSRVEDNHIPTVYPIVNLVTGLDFRIPSVPGLEIKVEGGFFFPYLFLGGGASYRI